MAVKCPKCSATVDAAPDELGLVTCGQCGARLRGKQTIKVTVQGGASSSSPSLPRIDPSVAAHADVDHVLARLDSHSPDETVRPGAIAKRAPSVAGPQAGAVFDMLLSELRAIKKTQEQILELLKERPASEVEHRGGGSVQRTVLLVDDDPKTLKEAEAALLPLATVKTASDGNSALATLALEKPTAVVLELGISGSLAGRDLVNMMKATVEWVDIPIVLYTKLPLGQERDACQRHGADEIVPKGPGAGRALALKMGAILRRA